jgi:hypothetical protein
VDWGNESTTIEVESGDLVRPPLILLSVTFVIAVVSALMAAWSSQVGYLVAVAASIAGGCTALQDQKRRGHPSYLILSWWRPALRVTRFGVLGVAMLHVALLAIDASRGGGIVGRLIFEIFT